MKLSDGKYIDQAFAIRYVASLPSYTAGELSQNKQRYTNTVSSNGKHYVKTGHWVYIDYDENLLGSVLPANVPSPTSNTPAIYESVTVHPRFYDAASGKHIRNPTAFRSAIVAAKQKNPQFLMVLGWNEYGSDNDEPSALESWTIGDNNKFGDAYVRILKDALYDYR